MIEYFTQSRKGKRKKSPGFFATLRNLASLREIASDFNFKCAILNLKSAI